MKLTEFRKLIREEVRKALKENTITLGDGKVIKNVSIDDGGIRWGNKKTSWDNVNYLFSTKKGKEQAFVNIVKSSELIQRLVIEYELGISDEEGIVDIIKSEDPSLSSEIKSLQNLVR